LALLVLRDGGSGYRAYIFEESIRRYAIDYKGRGRKEVIYLRVANISCNRLPVPCQNVICLTSVPPYFSCLALDSVTDSVYFYVFIPLDFYRFTIKSLV